MICAYCSEAILPGEDRADISNMDAHRECALRSALGGIGHLLDHAHFCRGVGPDAGLDHRTSALMVDIWVTRKGVEAAARAGRNEDVVATRIAVEWWEQDGMAHLAPDAPYRVCSECGRFSWSADPGDTCGMPQPTGPPCAGTFSEEQHAPAD